MARNLRVEIIGDASQYQRELKNAGRATQTFGSKLGGLGKAAGFAAGGAALSGLAIAAHRGFEELKESAAVAAQTAAVLKSTGGAAKVTAGHVEGLATSLSRMSGVDDEAIQAGENLLLTFTGVRNEVGKGNDIFDQATKSALDMSVALGQDMHSSVIQLGKALNDPIKGISALRRVGVSFTESQKDQIKALVASGKTMQAQKLILAELNKEFGGSAKAAGDTLPGQLNKLQNAFDELSAKGLTLVFQELKEFEPAFKTVGDAIKKAMVVIGPLAKFLVDNIAAPFRVIADLIHGDWAKAWDDLKKPIQDALAFLSALGSVFSSAGAGIINSLWGGIQSAWKTVATFFTNIGATIQGWFASAGTWLVSAGHALVSGFVAGYTAAWTVPAAWLAGMGARVAASVVNAGEWLTAHGRQAMSGLLAGFVEGWVSVAGWLASTGGRVQNAVVNAGSWLVGKGTEAIAGLFAGMRAKWQEITGWLSSLGDFMRSLVGGSINWLVQAGRNALQGLYNGMLEIWNKIKSFISGIGSWIASHKGPLSYDLKLLEPAGQALMAGLHRGMSAGMRDVMALTQSIAPAISAQVGAGAAAGGGHQVNFHIGTFVGDQDAFIRAVEPKLRESLQRYKFRNVSAGLS